MGSVMDLYGHLGVEKTATPDEIKRAYKRRSAKLHPDNQQTGDEQRFLALTVARDTLLDDEARAFYDRTGDIPKKAPICNVVAMIRQVAVHCAAKDPKANLLGAIREHIGKERSTHLQAIRVCDTAIGEVEKRWSDGEMKEQVLEEFRASRLTMQARADLMESALKMLKDCKYQGVDGVRFNPDPAWFVTPQATDW